VRIRTGQKRQEPQLTDAEGRAEQAELVLGLVILPALGFLAFGISDVSGGCPSAVWHGVCAATAATPGRA
jgi:hypothetical protein